MSTDPRRELIETIVEQEMVRSGMFEVEMTVQRRIADRVLAVLGAAVDVTDRPPTPHVHDWRPGNASSDPRYFIACQRCDGCGSMLFDETAGEGNQP